MWSIWSVPDRGVGAEVDWVVGEQYSVAWCKKFKIYFWVLPCRLCPKQERGCCTCL